MLLNVRDINPIVPRSALISVRIIVLIDPHVRPICLLAGEAFNTESETHKDYGDRNDNCVPHGAYGIVKGEESREIKEG